MSGTIASPLAIQDHLKVFESLIVNQLNAIDRGNLLIKLIDTVPEDALIHLAGEFDVLGYKGWLLTNTVEEKRELIKNAIRIHRYKGTPYSIKEALKTLGLTNVEIQENVTSGVRHYDGLTYYDGLYYYGSYFHWALFNVIIDVTGTSVILTDEVIRAIKFMIEEYKAARCLLVILGLGLTFEENISISEENSLDEDDDETESIDIGFYYDGSYWYDGERQYDADVFELIITDLNPGFDYFLDFFID